jgi:hypothetical protein
MTPKPDARKYEERFEAIYRGLPPLDSPEYLQLLETAKPEELPAEVLVRVYRQLCQAEPYGEAARATIERLLVRHEAYYFQRVRSLAMKDAAGRKNWIDAEDMVQDVMMKVCELLPQERGRHAETNWVVFITNLSRDVWRGYHGRDGARRRAEQGEYDEEGLSLRLDFEELARYIGGAGPRHSGFDQAARMRAVIDETVAKISDSFLRQIAEDQLGPDPTPISSRREENAPNTLSGKLGVSRHVIERALRRARKIVGAALLSDPTLDLKEEWIRRFINPTVGGRTANIPSGD